MLNITRFNKLEIKKNSSPSYTKVVPRHGNTG